MRFVDQLITAIKYIALIGILAHVLGEALPRKWFLWDRFPYRTFLQETCVAEFVHWCLLLLSFPLYSYVPTPFGAAVTILYALSNLPFIFIQRYNRPRLLRLLNRRLNPQ